MKKSLLFVFLLLVISCSSNKELEVDIENLKKDGSVYLQKKKKTDVLEINNVNNILLYSLINQSKITWHYPYQNSQNLIRNLQIKNNYKSVSTDNFYNYNRNNYYKKEILITSDKIIYVDDYSNLFILDINFKILKKIQLHEKKIFEGYLLKHSLIINNNSLFISNNLGFIIAINLDNYSVLWKNNFTVPFLSNLVIYKDSIFVVNSNGKIYSFNIFNGSQNWSFETGANTMKSDLAFKIVLGDNNLFFSNDLGDIYAFNLVEKSILWNFKIDQNMLDDNNLFKLSHLIYENNFLYFSSSFGNNYKLNALNGNLVWKNDVESYAPSIINPNTIITVSKNTFLLIHEKSSGKILYKKNIKKLLSNPNIEFNNILLISNKIFITTSDGHFMIIDSSNLNNIVIIKVANEIKSNIVTNSDKFFFLGEKSFLYKVI